MSPISFSFSLVIAGTFGVPCVASRKISPHDSSQTTSSISSRSLQASSLSLSSVPHRYPALHNVHIFLCKPYSFSVFTLALWFIFLLGNTCIFSPLHVQTLSWFILKACFRNNIFVINCCTYEPILFSAGKWENMLATRNTRSGDLLAHLSRNCLSNGIVSFSWYCIVFNFSPFFRNSKIVTDGPTDRRTEGSSDRDARAHL